MQYWTIPAQMKRKREETELLELVPLQYLHEKEKCIENTFILFNTLII